MQRSIRLIHTADVHLDTSYAAHGMTPAFANRRRQSLRDVFAAILQRAVDWPADAVLVAGDLYEQDRISRDTVAFLRKAFESIRPIPVFIAPGNHDPWGRLSPYATEPWPANVFIFNRPEWAEHALHTAPLTVHGFAFDGPDISANPFGKLVPARDGRVHVAVAHGSEQSRQPAGKSAYAPFDARDAAVDGLAYLALGHFHRVTCIEGNFQTPMYYSGAPEGHGFDECGPHHFLEVEIPLEHPNALVRPVVSSRAVYENKDLDCSEFTHAQELVDALRRMAGPAAMKKLLRVRLHGICAPSLRPALGGLRDVLRDLFEYLEIFDESQPEENYDVLACEDTSLGEFARQTAAAIEAAPDVRTRTMLCRAREVGLAAYQGQDIPVHGIGNEAG